MGGAGPELRDTAGCWCQACIYLDAAASMAPAGASGSDLMWAARPYGLRGEEPREEQAEPWVK